jgi:preprotein translocase subunit SecA
MIGTVIKKVIGSKNERELRKLKPVVELINSLEKELEPLTDAELREKTDLFRKRLAEGETMEDLLPETFALVREAARRNVGMRHFDVQLIGGMVLHQGKIAEMATGEGKTLVATLAAYLNALEGKGVHVITVNDYLARRDTEWMGPIYQSLGLTVGTVQHEMDDQERKKAYRCDITYGTNNEFGFDYLRDNMKFNLEDCVQREFNYAIVDEVDSILIDEARTPLIISGPAEESTDKYYKIDRAIPRLKKTKHYQIDEKARTVSLTEEGVVKTEEILGVQNLYDPSNIDILHHVNQALRAHTLFKRDVDYVVTDGQVIIVDEFTGRLMPGRRYSDGLHQALEAKERVEVANENQTLASITFQNYFRMYDKLAGMTGTAETEAEEFMEIYNLEVVVIPTNRPLVRQHYPDVIYRTEKEKFRAAVKEIEELHRVDRPVLVGTISIDKSEHLSKLLKRNGIPHHVLNAKHHEQEAEIVAQAGQPGAVTIATNMAGRGTDIVLGEGVAERGGLHILGTERHESRRIDNQLRGRAGRQGDPGSSRFYLSLEDDLLRIFGSDRISRIMEKLGMEEGQPIEHNLLSRAIEGAQKRVEGHNFDIRKHLLEYDDVMNKQREVIYEQRRIILKGKDLRENILGVMEELVDELVDQYAGEKLYPDEWDLKGLEEGVFRLFGMSMDLTNNPELEEVDREELRDHIQKTVQDNYLRKVERYGADQMEEIERMVMLHVIDSLWKDHLLNMDHLKEGIGLRGYGQKDPLIEYKREGYDMFMDLVGRIKEETVEYLSKIEVEEREDKSEPLIGRRVRTFEHRGEIPTVAPDEAHGGGTAVKTVRREGRKIGRNEPCPCGSGLKYKRCCGR